MLERAPCPHDDVSLLTLHRTHAAAVRTRLLRAHVPRLLPGGRFQSARQKRLHGRHRDIFHLRERYIQTRPLFAPMLPNDNLSPAFGQLANVIEILRSQFAHPHRRLLQRDQLISLDEILPKPRL